MLRGGRGEVVDEGVGVLEDVVNKHGVFANRMVDFSGQHAGVASGAGMDVFPLLQHLFRIGRLSEQATLLGRYPLCR